MEIAVEIGLKLLFFVLVFIFMAVLFFIVIFNREISDLLKAKVEYRRKVNANFDEIIQEGKRALYDEFRECVRKDLAEIRGKGNINFYAEPVEGEEIN